MAAAANTELYHFTGIQFAENILFVLPALNRYRKQRKKDPDGPLLVALKGRVTDQELAELGLPAGDVTVKVLEVPGRDHRHAIMIESTRRPPAEP